MPCISSKSLALRVSLLVGLLTLVGLGCSSQSQSCEDITRLCLQTLHCNSDKTPIKIEGCGCVCPNASLAKKTPIVYPQKNGGVQRPDTTSGGQSKDIKVQSNLSLDTSLPERGSSKVVDVTALPSSERVFALDEDGDGVDELFGSRGNRLWRYSTANKELRREHYDQEGTVQRMAVGTWHHARHVFAVLGRGRGIRAGVSLLMRKEGTDGFGQTPLFQQDGARNDISALAWLPQSGSFPGGLMMSVFTNKYFVKTLLFNPLFDGENVRTFHDAERMSMLATAWQPELALPHYRVVGRLYGDAIGDTGSLRLAPIQTQNKTNDTFNVVDKAWQSVNINGGIRAMVLGRTKENAPKRLYVADGWVAEYKRKGRAQLKEVRLVNGAFKTHLIGDSKDEYTFFELWARDLDGDGIDEIIARGDKYLTYFKRTAEGWKKKRLSAFGPVLNVALLKRKDGGWFVAIPGKTKTKLFPLSQAEVNL